MALVHFSQEGFDKAAAFRDMNVNALSAGYRWAREHERDTKRGV